MQLAVVADNCTTLGFENFPQIFTYSAQRYDIAILSLAITLYAFLGFAIVCEEYLAHALIEICYRLDMTIVMADATVLAFGTALPEFFICIISVVIAKSDFGFCTIIGSVAFDSFAVVGLCGLIAKTPFSLDWWTATRDLSATCLGIVPLVFILNNGVIALLESGLLIACYVIYVTYLSYDRFLQLTLRDMDESNPRTGTKCYRTNPAIVPNMREKFMKHDEEELENVFHPLRWPATGTVLKTIWILSWPLQVLFIFTIPDCRRKYAKSYYWLTVLMSTVWVALLSYIVSWCAAILSYHLQIPTAIVGLTLLAVGSTAPDVVSCILMVHEASSARGVYYALTINNLKILFYLGLAYLAEDSLVLFWPTIFESSTISAHLVYITALLCFGLIIIYLLLLCTHFDVNRWIGCMFILIYLLYIGCCCCFIKLE